MATFPSQDSVNQLKQLGVTYVVVDSSSYDNFSEVEVKIQSLGLHLLHISEAEYVYGLP
jgi:hypothetical protein